MRVRVAIVSAALVVATPASAQMLIYDSNPRIIHVPQANSYAAAPAAHVAGDDEIVGRVESKKQQPRRILQKAAAEPVPRHARLPPAPETKRALLSAPLVDIGPGSLTPIYPTPRWRNADPPPAVTVDNNDTLPQ